MKSVVVNGPDSTEKMIMVLTYVDVVHVEEGSNCRNHLPKRDVTIQPGAVLIMTAPET